MKNPSIYLKAETSKNSLLTSKVLNHLSTQGKSNIFQNSGTSTFFQLFNNFNENTKQLSNIEVLQKPLNLSVKETEKLAKDGKIEVFTVKNNELINVTSIFQKYSSKQIDEMIEKKELTRNIHDIFIKPTLSLINQTSSEGAKDSSLIDDKSSLKEDKQTVHQKHDIQQLSTSKNTSDNKETQNVLLRVIFDGLKNQETRPILNNETEKINVKDKEKKILTDITETVVEKSRVKSNQTTIIPQEYISNSFDINNQFFNKINISQDKKEESIAKTLDQDKKRNPLKNTKEKSTLKQEYITENSKIMLGEIAPSLSLNKNNKIKNQSIPMESPKQEKAKDSINDYKSNHSLLQGTSSQAINTKVNENINNKLNSQLNETLSKGRVTSEHSKPNITNERKSSYVDNSSNIITNIANSKSDQLSASINNFFKPDSTEKKVINEPSYVQTMVVKKNDDKFFRNTSERNEQLNHKDSNPVKHEKIQYETLNQNDDFIKDNINVIETKINHSSVENKFEAIDSKAENALKTNNKNIETKSETTRHSTKPISKSEIDKVNMVEKLINDNVIKVNVNSEPKSNNYKKNIPNSTILPQGYQRNNSNLNERNNEIGKFQAIVKDSIPRYIPEPKLLKNVHVSSSYPKTEINIPVSMTSVKQENNGKINNNLQEGTIERKINRVQDNANPEIGLNKIQNNALETQSKPEMIKESNDSKVNNDQKYENRIELKEEKTLSEPIVINPKGSESYRTTQQINKPTETLVNKTAHRINIKTEPVKEEIIVEPSFVKTSTSQTSKPVEQMINKSAEPVVNKADQDFNSKIASIKEENITEPKFSHTNINQTSKPVEKVINKSAEPMVSRNTQAVSEKVSPVKDENIAEPTFIKATINQSSKPVEQMINKTAEPMVNRTAQVVSEKVSPKKEENITEPKFSHTNINQTSKPVEQVINKSAEPKVNRTDQVVSEKVSPVKDENIAEPTFIKASINQSSKPVEQMINKTAEPKVSRNTQAVSEKVSPKKEEIITEPKFSHTNINQTSKPVEQMINKSAEPKVSRNTQAVSEKVSPVKDENIAEPTFIKASINQSSKPFEQMINKSAEPMVNRTTQAVNEKVSPKKEDSITEPKFSHTNINQTSKPVEQMINKSAEPKVSRNTQAVSEKVSPKKEENITEPKFSHTNINQTSKPVEQMINKSAEPKVSRNTQAVSEKVSPNKEEIITEPKFSHTNINQTSKPVEQMINKSAEPMVNRTDHDFNAKFASIKEENITEPKFSHTNINQTSKPVEQMINKSAEPMVNRTDHDFNAKLASIKEENITEPKFSHTNINQTSKPVEQMINKSAEPMVNRTDHDFNAKFASIKEENITEPKFSHTNINQTSKPVEQMINKSAEPMVNRTDHDFNTKIASIKEENITEPSFVKTSTNQTSKPVEQMINKSAEPMVNRTDHDFNAKIASIKEENITEPKFSHTNINQTSKPVEQMINKESESILGKFDQVIKEESEQFVQKKSLGSNDFRQNNNLLGKPIKQSEKNMNESLEIKPEQKINIKSESLNDKNASEIKMNNAVNNRTVNPEQILTNKFTEHFSDKIDQSINIRTKEERNDKISVQEPKKINNFETIELNQQQKENILETVFVKVDRNFKETIESNNQEKSFVAESIKPIFIQNKKPLEEKVESLKTDKNNHKSINDVKITEYQTNGQIKNSNFKNETNGFKKVETVQTIKTESGQELINRHSLRSKEENLVYSALNKPNLEKSRADFKSITTPNTTKMNSEIGTKENYQRHTINLEESDNNNNFESVMNSSKTKDNLPPLKPEEKKDNLRNQSQTFSTKKNHETILEKPEIKSESYSQLRSSVSKSEISPIIDKLSSINNETKINKNFNEVFEEIKVEKVKVIDSQKDNIYLNSRQKQSGSVQEYNIQKNERPISDKVNISQSESNQSNTLKTNTKEKPFLIKKNSQTLDFSFSKTGNKNTEKIENYKSDSLIDKTFFTKSNNIRETKSNINTQNNIIENKININANEMEMQSQISDNKNHKAQFNKENNVSFTENINFVSSEIKPFGQIYESKERANVSVNQIHQLSSENKTIPTFRFSKKDIDNQDSIKKSNNIDIPLKIKSSFREVTQEGIIENNSQIKQVYNDFKRESKLDNESINSEKDFNINKPSISSERMNTQKNQVFETQKDNIKSNLSGIQSENKKTIVFDQIQIKEKSKPKTSTELKEKVKSNNYQTKNNELKVHETKLENRRNENILSENKENRKEVNFNNQNKDTENIVRSQIINKKNIGIEQISPSFYNKTIKSGEIIEKNPEINTPLSNDKSVGTKLQSKTQNANEVLKPTNSKTRNFSETKDSTKTDSYKEEFSIKANFRDQSIKSDNLTINQRNLHEKTEDGYNYRVINSNVLKQPNQAEVIADIKLDHQDKEVSGRVIKQDNYSVNRLPNTTRESIIQGQNKSDNLEEFVSKATIIQVKSEPVNNYHNERYVSSNRGRTPEAMIDPKSNKNEIDNTSQPIVNKTEIKLNTVLLNQSNQSTRLVSEKKDNFIKEGDSILSNKKVIFETSSTKKPEFTKNEYNGLKGRENLIENSYYSNSKKINPVEVKQSFTNPNVASIENNSYHKELNESKFVKPSLNTENASEKKTIISKGQTEKNSFEKEEILNLKDRDGEKALENRDIDNGDSQLKSSEMMAQSLQNNRSSNNKVDVQLRMKGNEMIAQSMVSETQGSMSENEKVFVENYQNQNLFFFKLKDELGSTNLQPFVLNKENPPVEDSKVKEVEKEMFENKKTISTIKNKQEQDTSNKQKDNNEFGKAKEDNQSLNHNYHFETISSTNRSFSELLNNQRLSYTEMYNKLLNTAKQFSSNTQSAQFEFETTDQNRITSYIEKKGNNINIIFKAETVEQSNFVKNEMQNLEQQLKDLGYNFVNIEYHTSENGHNQHQSSQEKRSKHIGFENDNTIEIETEIAPEKRDLGYNTVEYVI